MTVMELPEVTEDIAPAVADFIRKSAASAGCSGAVIGLSGGLDSAVAAKLTADALGYDNVLCVFMPYGKASVKDRDVCSDMCGLWGIELKVIDITSSVDTFLSSVSGDQTPVDIGNAAARCRMAILYNIARRNGRIVVGTSNLSERMMGYFTKYGDGACDISPLAGLYKTQVRQLASFIGVPCDIISKPPSAGFWEGQTDEEEMGISYTDLDKVLCGIDSGMDDGTIAYCTGVSGDKVAEIRNTVDRTSHKRSMPDEMTFDTVF